MVFVLCLFVFRCCILVIEWFEQRFIKHQCSIVIFRSGRCQASPPCEAVRKHFNFNSLSPFFCILFFKVFHFIITKIISLIPIFFILWYLFFCLFFRFCIIIIEWFEQRFMAHQCSTVIYRSGRCHTSPLWKKVRRHFNFNSFLLIFSIFYFIVFNFITNNKLLILFPILFFFFGICSCLIFLLFFNDLNSILLCKSVQ